MASGEDSSGRDLGVDNDVRSTQAAREGENGDEDVDVADAPALALSGFKSQRFTFSEIDRTRRRQGQTLSEGFVGTSRLHECEHQSSILSFNLLF